tara:strand:+ start:190 stop:528 length:339 start_codon:yes stop_codon:yes gene_type:complete
MSHLFCHTCGFKIEYANVKPNFCGKCGQQLNNTFTPSIAAQQPNVVENVNLAEDETNSQSLPSISKIQVDYDIDTSNSFTLGSLVGDKTPPEVGRRSRPKSINEFINERGEQ